MLKTIKIKFIFIFLILSQVVIAQDDMNSPYSRYGMGELMGNAQTGLRSMGGISYGVRKNNIINSYNPASYTGFDTLSFVFDIGLQFKQSELKTSTLKQNTNDANVTQFAIGFPIFRWWKSSIGLLPMANMEYQTKIPGKDSLGGNMTYLYSGSGGLRKVYWGNAFSPTKNLSIGANLNFVFGDLSKIRTAHFDSTYIFDSRFEDHTYIHNLTFDFGAQYTLKLNERDNLIIGAVYSPKLKRNTKVDLFDHTLLSNNVNSTLVDTVTFSQNVESKIQYPASFGIGLTYNHEKKWMVGADFTYTNWSDLRINEKSDSLQNSWKIAVGGEWKPNPVSPNYFKRTAYRLGFLYESSYLNLQNTSLSKMAVTAGFGLPLRKSYSTINVGIELGKFGTTQNNLIQEKYFQISVSFSAYDIWFIKRKYE